MTHHIGAPPPARFALKREVPPLSGSTPGRATAMSPSSSTWPPYATPPVRPGFWTWPRAGPRRSSRPGSPSATRTGVSGLRWWRWTTSPGSTAPPARSSPRPGRSWTPTRVVALAAGKLDQCRHRIQRAITGRAGDRLYRARRTLRTGAGLLTDTQTRRLEALFTDDRHAAVQASWGRLPAPGSRPTAPRTRAWEST